MQVFVGKVYRHYSGKEYIVNDIVRSSEDLEEYVIYQGLYICPKFGPQPKWARPLKMFVEEVEIDGIKQPRFKKIDQVDKQGTL